MSIEKQSIKEALAVMQEALEDPAVRLLDSSNRYSLYEDQISIEDLDRLFHLMAKAAILFQRRSNGAHHPGPWRDILAERSMNCAVVCKMASQWPLAYINDDADICYQLGNEYASGWEYMADLFLGIDVTITKPRSIKEIEREFVKTHKGAGLSVIKTAYSSIQLGSIFERLAEAGYIDGTSENAAQDFLNAFNPKADRQGYISWIWPARNTGSSQTQILQFVFLMLGEPIADDLTYTSKKDLFEAVSVIFGIPIKSGHISRLKKGVGKDVLTDLRAIINPA